jgi:hypothetical protein
MQKQVNQQVKDQLSFWNAKAVMSLLLFAVLIVSCNKDKTEYTLQIQPETVEFTNAGGKQTVAVTSNIEGWTHSVDDSWVTATKTATGIELTASPNPGAERTTSLRITAGSYTAENKVIEIRQGATSWSVSPVGTATLSPEGELLAVTVTANVDWDFEISSSGNGWLTATKTATGLNLTAVENPNADSRTATLSVASELYGLESTLTLTQGGSDPVLVIDSEDELSIPSVAGAVEVTVTANAGWDFAVEPVVNWLLVEKTETGVKLTVIANPVLTTRSVSLTISGEHGLERTITVTQRGYDPSGSLPDLEGTDFESSESN